MADRVTVPTKVSVKDFLAGITHPQRKEDAQAVVKMMQAASGQKPVMWGPTIIGFGEHRYKIASGKEESVCKIGFAPRATSLVFYLGNFRDRVPPLKKLGKHKLSGGGCLYINKLKNVDVAVLQQLIQQAYRNKSGSAC